MGSSSSTFQNDLKSINNFVKNILEQVDKKTINCDDYQMVIESSLKKHIKVELEELKDSIYIVPKNPNINYEKKQLCNLISTHYARIIKIIKLIKSVYDLENDGKYSIAAICMGNVVINKNLMTIKVYYCDTEQKDNELGVNFEKLSGLKSLCEELLDKEEKNILLSNLQTIISDNEIKCGNKLFKNEDYSQIFGKKISKCESKQESKQYKDHEYNIKVQKNNPIISDSICLSTKYITVGISGKVIDKQLLKYYNIMHEHYNKNIESIFKTIMKLIDIDKNNKITLKNINNVQLDKIENDAKINMSKLYIQSIYDYKVLFNYAKSNIK
jgi:hypothetical protein